MDTKRCDWQELKAAWGGLPGALDTDAIMAAVRREAAVRPVRGAARGGAGGWWGAAAVAASLAWAAFTLAQAGGTAERQIGLAWLNGIEPGALESEVLASGGGEMVAWAGAAERNGGAR